MNKLDQNFIGDNGKICLVRCTECDMENYAPAVMSGICVWCEFDANKEVEDENPNI